MLTPTFRARQGGEQPVGKARGHLGGTVWKAGPVAGVSPGRVQPGGEGAGIPNLSLHSTRVTCSQSVPVVTWKAPGPLSLESSVHISLHD